MLQLAGNLNLHISLIILCQNYFNQCKFKFDLLVRVLDSKRGIQRLQPGVNLAEHRVWLVLTWQLQKKILHKWPWADWIPYLGSLCPKPPPSIPSPVVQMSDKITGRIINHTASKHITRSLLLIILKSLRCDAVPACARCTSRAGGADLCQKEEENVVVGEDGVWCDAQQEVLQANPPSLDKVWVKVVCRQLVPHKLCLQESQLNINEHASFLLTFKTFFQTLFEILQNVLFANRSFYS